MAELKKVVLGTLWNKLLLIHTIYEINFLEDFLKMIPSVFEVETLPVLESGHDLEYLRA